MPDSANSARENPSTHDRILDGAMHAIARHGLGKLAMRDVGVAAGVARGTVYRHFANREALLEELGQREAARFIARWRDALASVPAGEQRMRAVLDYPARFAREYPVLQRLLETDPDYVLRAIRDHYAAICATVEQLIGPVVAENPFAKAGLVPKEQLVDWFVRLMISNFLFPAEDPETVGRDLSVVYRALRANG
jgi:AcrR family transcriptional regulator